MSAPNYAGVIARGSGFQPGESLVIDMTSDSEGGKGQAIATQEGTYTAVILPAVKGQKSGTGSVRMTSPKCSVAVQFPWGDGSYRLQ
jgi:hypothetical protein